MSPLRVSKAVAEVTGYASAWSTAHGVRAFQWTFAFLCDEWSGLSLNRFLAIAFALDACHVRLVRFQFLRDSLPTTWQDIAMAIIAGSLAFGKDVWLSYLEHKKCAPPPESAN